MKSKLTVVWYVFMAFIFAPAFMIAPHVRLLSLSETINFSYNFIGSEFLWFVASILQVPVGIVAYLLPNDMGYFVMAFQLIFMMVAPFVIILFFATTYPPEFMRVQKPEQEGELQQQAE